MFPQWVLPLPRPYNDQLGTAMVTANWRGCEGAPSARSPPRGIAMTLAGPVPDFRASLRRALSGGRYRVSETVLRRDSLSDFNDGCRDFAELRTLILQARAAAMNDMDAVPTAGPDLDIEADELVM